MSKKTVAPKKSVPPALARVDARQVAKKQKRLADEARADIDLIQRRRRRITEDFYDVGEALVRLKRPGVAAALGHSSFSDLCTKELAMGATKVDELIRIVTRVRREDAVRFGQDRTTALVALADATPEEDSPAKLARATLRLPSGKTLDVAKASARALFDGAKEIRAAKTSRAKPRGRTTTPQERETCVTIETSLRSAGIVEARVVAVATKPGREATVRIERVPLSKLAVLAKVLRAAKT